MPSAVPAGFSREDHAGGLVLARKWRSWKELVVLLPLTFVLFFWARLMPLDPAELDPTVARLLPWLFPAFGLLLAYYCVATIFNSTRVEVSPDLLRVVTGPVPFYRTICVATAEIKQVDFCESAGNGYSTSYEVVALLPSGEQKTLVKGLRRVEHGDFYVRELRAMLGLMDHGR